MTLRTDFIPGTILMPLTDATFHLHTESLQTNCKSLPTDGELEVESGSVHGLISQLVYSGTMIYTQVCMIQRLRSFRYSSLSAVLSKNG
jgi:hypothetical protein